MEIKKRRAKFYFLLLLTLVCVIYLYFMNSNLNNNKAHSRKNDLQYLDRPVICVLVLACNRPTVKRCIDSVLKYRSLTKTTNFPLIVSQDCGSHPETTKVIESYGDKLLHIHQPDLQEIKNVSQTTKIGYYKQTRHHAWALQYVFSTLKCPNAITLEDDLEVAPDFFEYFAATLPILRKDRSLYCVTASNIQAKPGKVNETAVDLLHRTDFFFGWGWMITNRVFRRLGPWPRVYWDAWMGLPNIREDRACIRPEIPRTKNFGRDGTSGHEFFDDVVQNLIVNEKYVPFTTMNLSYLYKDNYNQRLTQQIQESIIVQDLRNFTANLKLNNYPTNATLCVTYNSPHELQRIAKSFDIYGQTSNGIAHTMYHGVMTFMFRSRRIYLVPGQHWRGYDYFSGFDNT